MSDSIDERVVQMKFDNAQFERGVKQTLTSMDALNKSLTLKGATQGLDNVAKSAGRLSLAGIADGVQNISNKFSALGVIGVTALANIANKAVNAGTTMLKSLTFSPIMAGFHEYETNLNSIQTILANTGLEGKKGLAQVNAALGNLNKYSDQTIYNFSEMAKNIGTFTAAGVKLGVATGAIKGIANLAALSGSTAEQASTGMYQLSQAIASGTVKLQDWNSVQNAGFGGKIFQNALKQTARTHGVAVDAIIKKEGSFRESLSKGWLSSKILTETLNQFTGDMTKKQLKQLGYTDKQIVAIQKMAKTAKDAATKIKTFSQLLGALQEAVGSGWAQTWQTLVGDFGEAKTLFTNINDVVGGFIQRSSDARNKVLKDWKTLGGRTAILNSIANVFHALIAVIKPIRDAFRDIFPATTGKQLADISKAIESFTKHLIIGGKTSEGLKNTFKGLFAIFDIAKQVIFGLVGAVFRMFNVFEGGEGNIFSLTGSIGTLIVKFDEWLKKTDFIGKAFDKLVKAVQTARVYLQPLFDVISKIGDAFSQLGRGGFAAFLSSLEASGVIFGDVSDRAQQMYDSVKAVVQGFTAKLGEIENPFKGLFDFGGEANEATDKLNIVNTAFETTASTGEKVKTAWQNVVDAFKAVGAFLGPVIDGIKQAFSAIGQGIKDFVSGLGVEDALATINTGFFIAFYIMLRKFIASLKDIVGSAKGVLDAASGTFNQLTANLKTMQQDVKANIIVKIAVAVAILAASLWLLSKLDLKQTAVGLGGIAVGLGIMVGAMKALSAMTADKNILDSSKLVILSVALAAMGLAMMAMAAAVATFGSMDTKTLAKGLGAIAITLAALTGAVKLLEMAGGPAGMVSAAFSILVLSAALTAFAGAMKLYSMLDTDMMKEGGLKIAASIAAVGIAMKAMPKDSLKSAAALYVVSAALVVIAGALKVFASLSGGDSVQAIVTMGAALWILTSAVIAMNAAKQGAIAMIIVAGALLVLAKALQMMGSMSLAEIGKSMLALVAAFVVLGVAGLVLGPVVPILLGLGIAVALLGAGAMLAGVGLLAFSAGLAALAVTGAAGAAAALAAIAVFAEAIPLLMEQFGLGVVAFAAVIAKSAPKLIAALVVVLSALIDAGIKLLPKIAQLFDKIIVTILGILVRNVPKIVVAAYDLVIGVVKGITQKIPQVAKAAVDLILAFLNAIAKEYPRLVDGAAKAVIQLVNGVADAIDANSAALGEAGGRLAVSIVTGMASGITAGAGQVAKAARDMAWGAVKAAANAIDSHSPSKEFEKLGKYSVQGFAKGLTGNRDQITAAYSTMKGALVDAYKASGEDIKQLTEKLEKLQSARHKDLKAISKTKAMLAQANKEHAKEKAAYTSLSKYMDDDVARLKTLATRYDGVAKKLDAANSKLKDAKKTRDDYNASIKNQYSDLPDIAADQTAIGFTEDLKKQLEDVQKYAILLQELRKKGLNDDLYKELLAKGPEAMAFAQNLLETGDIKLVNSLDAQLVSAAGKLGSTASKELYQAGVDAAQGLVNGLIKQEKAIQKQMDKIADYMVKAIKRKLGIKSPSTVMYGIGEFTGEGLIDGLDSMSSSVANSADGIGKDAILALRKSLSGLTNLPSDMELNPTITPVIDLSEVKKGASAVSAMLDTLQPLKVDSSYLAAKDASLGYQANQAALQELAAALSQPTTEINYEQNNYSPKALSDAEIYRQTNNQLSVTKGALP